MTAAKRSYQRRNSPRCPRRLQIERLEHRLVMSAATVTDATTLAFLAAEQSIEEVSVSIAPANQNAGVNNAQSQAAAGFEHFNSLDELKEFLITEAVKQYENMFGKETSLPCCYPLYTATFDLGFALFNTSATANAATLTAASTNYSETNTQVDGVDEADLMETDGDYLYMLSRGELVIIDVRSIDTPTIASRLRLDRSVSSMYLSGDRLTLISQHNNYYCGGFEIIVLDISDRKAPEVVQRTLFEGNLIDSRAIGDKVYLVINNWHSLPAPEVVNMDGSSLEGNANDPDGQYRYETEQEYRQRMADYMEKYALPSYTSYDAEGKEISSGFISDPDRLYKRTDLEDWNRMTTVAVIDMGSNEPGPADAISLPGYVSEVYVSGENMYLIGSNCSDRTLIRKVDLANNEGKLQFIAKGIVDGYVLDQFSVDEHNGFLRIATTEGWAGVWPGQGNSLNHLFVLAQNGTALDIVGSVERLAPGEKIYSARFLGDQAFVVTYRQVDPLFAIDLSDPTAPKVNGELKIPGFSNYLHAIDGGLLIGIGRDADEGTGLYQDPQVSLFDVDDLNNPILVDRFTIHTGRTGGLNIFDDHHVVAYYPDCQILTVSVPDMNDSGTYSWNNVNDLYVFQVDTSGASASLELLGKIEHDDSVLRSVQIDDRLLSISNDSIEVHELTNPEVILATLMLNENNMIQPTILPPIPLPPIVSPPIMPQPILQPIFWPIDINPIIGPGRILPIEITEFTFIEPTVPGMSKTSENTAQQSVEATGENQLTPNEQKPAIMKFDPWYIQGLIQKAYNGPALIDSVFSSRAGHSDTFNSLSNISWSSVDKPLRNSQISGTVDHLMNYEKYESFLESSLDIDTERALLLLNIDQRVKILISRDKGNPLGDVTALSQLSDAAKHHVEERATDSLIQYGIDIQGRLPSSVAQP